MWKLAAAESFVWELPMDFLRCLLIYRFNGSFIDLLVEIDCTVDFVLILFS